MRRHPAPIFFTFLLFFFSAAAGEENEDAWYEITNAKIVKYNISGSSQKELSDEMKRKGPNGYFGYTEWNFTWKCREIKVECLVTLPYWQTGESTPELQKKWRRFWNNLARHEQEHVEIVWKRVDETKERVKTMNCREAGEAWKSTLQQVNRESKEYDTRTDHGTTQGAIF